MWSCGAALSWAWDISGARTSGALLFNLSVASLQRELHGFAKIWCRDKVKALQRIAEKSGKLQGEQVHTGESEAKQSMCMTDARINLALKVSFAREVVQVGLSIWLDDICLGDARWREAIRTSTMMKTGTTAAPTAIATLATFSAT